MVTVGGVGSEQTPKPESFAFRVKRFVIRILSRIVLVIVGIPILPFVWFLGLWVGDGKERTWRYWIEGWKITWKDV